MVGKYDRNEGQIDRFKSVAVKMGLGQEPTESLDRIMGKLDLTKKPEPDKKPNDKK